MAKRSKATQAMSPAARVFSSLQADDVLLPGKASALRRSSAVLLALMVLVSAPLFWAANASGLIGDLPSAVAHSGSSGPGSGDDDDDDRSGPGDGGDDDDDSGTGTHTRTGARADTDDTSANGHSTRGTTNDDDTATKLGTDDTSNNGHSTRGTTNDNDTRTGGTGTNSRTGS